MSTKKLFRLSAATALAGAATLLGSCGSPAAPSDVPDTLNDRLMVFAVLDADSARQVIEVAAADHYTRPHLSGVRVTIHRQNTASGGPEWALVAEWDSARAAAAGVAMNEYAQCRRDNDGWAVKSFGIVTVPDRAGRYCMTPDAQLEAGATYRVEATADGRTPAWGETTVVGDFAVEVAALSGDRGSYALSAAWTPSAGTYRYFVAVRRRYEFCINCVETWYADVAEPIFAGNVPNLAVDSAGPNPMLDVAAVDPHLYAYLTTGHEGNLHEVHPVQNVRNGYGFVGSATYRSRRIAMPGAGQGS